MEHDPQKCTGRDEFCSITLTPLVQPNLCLVAPFFYFMQETLIMDRNDRKVIVNKVYSYFRARFDIETGPIGHR